MKRLGSLVIVLAALSVAAAAAAATVHVTVTPATTSPGGVITVAAPRSPCLSRDQVILISTAFPGHAYGMGAVVGHVGAHGAFAVRARIRSTIKAGRYSIGFRCGGGNLGVAVYVRVR